MKQAERPSLERSIESRIAVIVAIIAATAVIGGGAFLWVRHAATRLVDQGRVALEEGKGLGRSLTAAACVDTAVARHAAQATTGFGGQLNERLVFDGCLLTSQPSPELCREVPESGAIARSATWAVEECRRRGLGDASCPGLLLSLQHYCGRLLNQRQ